MKPKNTKSPQSLRLRLVVPYAQGLLITSLAKLTNRHVSDVVSECISKNWKSIVSRHDRAAAGVLKQNSKRSARGSSR